MGLGTGWKYMEKSIKKQDVENSAFFEWAKKDDQALAGHQWRWFTTVSDKEG